MLPSGTYLFHPKNGKETHTIDNIHTNIILIMADPFVMGFADNPLTITLYRSNAIIVIVQMDTLPNNDPSIA